MSLLIDALRKYRRESAPSLMAQAESNAEKPVKSNKLKITLILSGVLIVAIALTGIGSFLVFKHLEKRRIEHVIQGKAAKLEEIKSTLAAGSNGGEINELKEGGLRAKLEQRRQQMTDQANNTSTPSSDASTSDTAGSTNVGADNTSTDNASSTSAPVASSIDQSTNRMSRRSAMRKNVMANKDSSDDATSNNDNTATDDNSEDNDFSDDNSGDDNSDTGSDNSDNQVVKKVEIRAIPDQTGANNATYQKALGFMQANQYGKALTLLQNNDDLLFKTEGLSALLLARIYLITGEFHLAEDATEHALMLHVGSNIELLSLKAQALFMQQHYQEVIDLLSTASPDLSAFPEYYALLANAYMHADQASSAVSIFQQIVARFPNSANYWISLALAYQKTGEVSSALVAYRRAAQLSQEDPQISLFINQQLDALQAT